MDNQIMEQLNNDNEQAAAFVVQMALAVVAADTPSDEEDHEEEDGADPYQAPTKRGIHSAQPRGKRRKFDHAGCLRDLHRDYLGPNPLFGAEFELMFRVSRPRFELMLQDFGNSGIPFYRAKPSANKVPVASLEARLLLPLKTLAYRVSCHAFMDYFQVSQQFARDCCTHFDQALKQLYEKDFLGVPTAAECRAIHSLNFAAHGIPGMFGSLDCSQTFWNRCPTAWKGCYSGKDKRPTIVLEALCDYNCYFWHVNYGYAGSLNDINVLNLSPLLDKFINGTFAEMERLVVPFQISDQEFDEMFILVDGIYPRFSRFVKPNKHPSTAMEKVFAEWQESARKDIERAFGLLKGKFQWTARPINLFEPDDIANRMTACLILHNISIRDHVMKSHDNLRDRYDPIFDLLDDNGNHRTNALDLNLPADLAEQQGVETVDSHLTNVGARNCNEVPQNWVRSRKRLWDRLVDQEENIRLRDAIMNRLFDNVES
mmetsp:Transcript_15031/g.32775  ORF Transcript_15031/g.32775 Transcript_15031/m.32775 type:complete len:486 (+) Transcript_15031:39-1496(+)